MICTIASLILPVCQHYLRKATEPGIYNQACKFNMHSYLVKYHKTKQPFWAVWLSWLYEFASLIISCTAVCRHCKLSLSVSRELSVILLDMHYEHWIIMCGLWTYNSLYCNYLTCYNNILKTISHRHCNINWHCTESDVVCVTYFALGS